jgi:hypothetical protein
LKCVSTSENRLLEPVKTRICTKYGAKGYNHQFFFLTSDGEIRRDNLCLGFEDYQKELKSFNCHGHNGTQVYKKTFKKPLKLQFMFQSWQFLQESKQIYHKTSSQCIYKSKSRKLKVEECNADKIEQKWNVQYWNQG